MTRIPRSIAITAVATIVGFVLGWFIAGNRSEERLEKMVAFSWGDGKYGKAFYGAHVFVEPDRKGTYVVRARVHIGRGSGYVHDCGVLGQVEDYADAVARWGSIDWREDGLQIGDGTNRFFLPRAQLESHR